MNKLYSRIVFYFFIPFVNRSNTSTNITHSFVIHSYADFAMYSNCFQRAVLYHQPMHILSAILCLYDCFNFTCYELTLIGTGLHPTTFDSCFSETTNIPAVYLNDPDTSGCKNPSQLVPPFPYEFFRVSPSTDSLERSLSLCRH